MAFEKGKSGNPGGRPKARPFREALDMQIAAAGDDHKLLRKIARKLLDRAEKGDLTAIMSVADRLDGRPAQAIENDDDGPFEIINRIERVIVNVPGK